MNDHNWHFLETDPVTHVTKYVKFDEAGVIWIRETVPDWLAFAIIEDNKQKAKTFTENGGWKAAKQGAVVAAVPSIIDKEFKRKSGFDPKKGGWYDKDKYNSFLDDSDYAHFRTGGGKIGKRKAFV